MTDRILAAIKEKSLNKNNISFLEIKRIAGSNFKIHNELGYGRAILSSVKQLDQYLFSYGKMILSQWNTVFEVTAFLDWNIIHKTISSTHVNIQINDYGCGQGLASVLFHDALPDSYINNVTKINLVEPSVVAIKRARAVLECCYPNANILTIEKHIDNVTEHDISLGVDALKVHFFSNVLDIKRFDDQQRLFDKILSIPGKHYFIAVSHDREHNGGTPRLRHCYQYLLDNKYNRCYQINNNSKLKFNCNNGMPAIAFYISLEVYNGSFFKSR